MNRAARAIGSAALAYVLQACATTGTPGKAPAGARTAPPQLASAELERVRLLAPDFLARAERATDRANRAVTPDAHDDHAECAALLLEAAKREADRIELERSLLAEELRRDASLRSLAIERYAILALDSEAAIARAQPVTSPVGRQPQPAQRTAAELTRRARLSLATARALGAESGSLAEAERQLRRAIAQPAEARTALELAERVLERARASRASADVAR